MKKIYFFLSKGDEYDYESMRVNDLLMKKKMKKAIYEVREAKVLCEKYFCSTSCNIVLV